MIHAALKMQLSYNCISVIWSVQSSSESYEHTAFRLCCNNPTAVVLKQPDKMQTNKCSCAPIQLSLWTLTCKFYKILTCYKILIFFWISPQLLKDVKTIPHSQTLKKQVPGCSLPTTTQGTNTHTSCPCSCQMIDLRWTGAVSSSRVCWQPQTWWDLSCVGWQSVPWFGAWQGLHFCGFSFSIVCLPWLEVGLVLYCWAGFTPSPSVHGDESSCGGNLCPGVRFTHARVYVVIVGKQVCVCTL